MAEINAIMKNLSAPRENDAAPQEGESGSFEDTPFDPRATAWQSLASIPNDRLDGREVLLWHVAGYPLLCVWMDGWRDPVGRPVIGATLYADIGRPGEVTCRDR